MRLCKRGPDPNRLVEMVQRLGRLSLLRQNRPQVVVRVGELRIAPQRVAKEGDGFVQFALALPHGSEVVEAFREVRFQAKRVFEKTHRRFELAAPEKESFQVVVRDEGVRILAQRVSPEGLVIRVHVTAPPRERSQDPEGESRKPHGERRPNGSQPLAHGYDGNPIPGT